MTTTTIDTIRLNAFASGTVFTKLSPWFDNLATRATFIEIIITITKVFTKSLAMFLSVYSLAFETTSFAITRKSIMSPARYEKLRAQFDDFTCWAILVYRIITQGCTTMLGVMSCMKFRCYNFKIFNAIIQFVSVLMMYVFGWFQWPTKKFLHNHSMLTFAMDKSISSINARCPVEWWHNRNNEYHSEVIISNEEPA